ncbi:MAG: InlB B-repeat-containing protein [Bacillus subtilis]|nr:InlB B-repeat-containing protein [Bacillus subtilis]
MTPPENLTLYAKWTPALITITFVTNGAAAIEPMQVPYLSSYALPSPELEGYTFGGWYYDAEFYHASCQHGSDVGTRHHLVCPLVWHDLLHPFRYDGRILHSGHERCFRERPWNCRRRCRNGFELRGGTMRL